MPIVRENLTLLSPSKRDPGASKNKKDPVVKPSLL